MLRVNVLLVLLVLGFVAGAKPKAKSCVQNSKTTASGSKAKAGPYCPGDIIFNESFDTFDKDTWKHEHTLAGGGNWEFQWYSDDPANSFVESGKLHIRPTLTSDSYGEDFLKSGVIDLGPKCTDSGEFVTKFYGCKREGSVDHVLNPVKSARIRTIDSFAFKYGVVEINAKLPAGDWLWPAIWFLPKTNAYGGWPASGEIDLMESRGNRKLVDSNGVNIGVEQVGSTLHFGPDPSHNGWPTAHYKTNSKQGKAFNKGFNVYRLEWTEEKLVFKINNETLGTVDAGTGFWNRGNFGAGNNPWKSATKMAPFDQEFFILLNIAVGGTNFFPDNAINQSGPKPWTNNSPKAATDFYNGKNIWLPTWSYNKTKESSLQIDYIRIWAL